MNDPKKLNVTFTDEAAKFITSMAQKLETTPGQVITQALVLLKRAQGKKIILRDKSEYQLEIDQYVNI